MAERNAPAAQAAPTDTVSVEQIRAFTARERAREVAADIHEHRTSKPAPDEVSAVADLLYGRTKPKGTSDDSSTDAGADGAPADDQGTGSQAQSEESGEGDGNEGDAGAEGGGEDDGQAQPATIDDVAKALGVDKAELNKVQVRVGDQTLTLGELKAKLPEIAKLDAARVEFEDAKQAWDLERIDAHRRILALVDALPKQAIPPNLMRQLEAQHEETRQRESALLTTARKEWGDAKYAAAEREKIAAALKPYGISASEISAVMDHRFVLAMQDFAKMHAQIQAAKQAARKVPEPAQLKNGRLNGAAAPSKSTPRRGNFVPDAEMTTRVAAMLRR